METATDLMSAFRRCAALAVGLLLLQFSLSGAAGLCTMWRHAVAARASVARSDAMAACGATALTAAVVSGAMDGPPHQAVRAEPAAMPASLAPTPDLP